MFAQDPTYYCDIRNESFVASNVFEFDVYLTRTGSTPLELACFNAGIKLNSSFVNGGSVSTEIVDGSDLVPAQVPTNIAYDAPTNCIEIAPQKPPRDYATGITSGTIISDAEGTKVCRVRLTNSSDFGADPANYTWSMALTPYRTVVSAFLAGGTPLINAAITDDASQSVSGNITMFLEGFYDGGTNRKAQDELGDHFVGPVSDLITVSLASDTPPYNVVFTSSAANLYTNGKVSFSVPGYLSGSYYIVVNHRNSIQTWSALPVDFGSGTVSYDFTDYSDKAYANNMIEVSPGQWAIYGGDVNQDGLIDSSDAAPVDNEAAIAGSGYILEDVNGDGLVDSSDASIIDNSAAFAVGVVTP